MTESKQVYHTKHTQSRTYRFPSARITLADLNKLARILKAEHQSAADWAIEHIQQDYLRLFGNDKILS